MILVVVDDLMFRSRISSAARAAGVETRVATTPDAALERARADHPSLVCSISTAPGHNRSKS